MKNILQSYKRGLMCARYNWKLIILLYLMNLFMMFIAMGPMSNLMKRVLGNSYELDSFKNGFNYTTVMDVMNNHGDAVGISLSAIFAMFIPYALWIVFSSGGIVEVTKTYSVRSTLFLFWKGAAMYFFRFFRITIYILLAYCLLFLLLHKFFVNNGIFPFDFSVIIEQDSENLIINRFRIGLVLFVLGAFFIATFRDLAKVIVGHHDELVIFQSVKEALKKTFSPRFLFLSLINVLVLLLLFALYGFLKEVTGNAFVVGIIISQIFLVFRVAYRIVRLGSFEQLQKTTIT